MRTLEIYAKFIVNLDYHTTKEAIHRLAAERDFFPSIAEIRKAATEPQGMQDPDEAWEEVLAAIPRYGRYREPKFSTPELAASVKRFGWTSLCNSTEEQIPTLRAQFRKFFVAECSRVRTNANVGPRLYGPPRPDEIPEPVKAVALALEAPKES